MSEIPVDDSIPQSGDGRTEMSASIVPQKVGVVIRVDPDSVVTAETFAEQADRENREQAASEEADEITLLDAMLRAGVAIKTESSPEPLPPPDPDVVRATLLAMFREYIGYLSPLEQSLHEIVHEHATGDGPMPHVTRRGELVLRIGSHLVRQRKLHGIDEEPQI